MSQRERTNSGKVYLVGAGPGDPDLITVRGLKTLALADLVLYDYLVNSELLKHARAEGELVSLGHAHGGRGLTQEEVNRRMIAAAREGKTVVRLKSGDPNLFGRGAEEIAELVAAGIPYEVVPGVTAALAAASHAGIPLTHREHASAVALVTGHQRNDKEPLELDFDALARFPGTLVFYMGMTTARQWSEALVKGGRSPDTPVAIVRRATWPDQQVFRTTLGGVADLIERGPLRPPAVIIIGEVACSSEIGGQRSEVGDRTSVPDFRPLTSDPRPTGLLIVCHGSPLPAANQGFVEMVGRIAARLGRNHVLPAFFALLRPNIQDQVAELASRGVDRIVILPYFLFQGQHVGVDIPNILAQCREWFPQVTLELLPTLESDPAVETLVVQRLLPLVADRR